MDVRVKFLGGAGTVTGSKYLLSIGKYNILIDCGLFQGRREIRERNWDDFSHEKIDAVVLTHAHLDHSGYLPRLVKQGYEGPVFCTHATAALAEILLRDAAKLLTEESNYINKKIVTDYLKPTEPLYEPDDVERVLTRWNCFHYYQHFDITENISGRFYNAGHILGSAILELTIKGDTQTKKLIFSGDLGRPDSPIHYPADKIEEADVVFVESTYGDREMPEDATQALADVVNESHARGGMLLIPAFAVGRTQQLIYLLKKLRDANKIPKIPIYVDSPMAINVTFLFSEYYEYHRLEEKEFNDVFMYEDIHYFQEKELSKSLNNIDRACIVISASGMCNGGRIMHHLYHRLPRPEDTLLFVGYQAEETRGREILEKSPTTSIFGIQVPIRCAVKKINGLSAHADRSELIDWLQGFKRKPKWTFIVHGEKRSNEGLLHAMENELGWKGIVPEFLENIMLFNGI